MARTAVVLPAPSGPISPNISPRFTPKDTSPSAVTAPKRFTTLVNSMADIERNLRFDGHPLLEDTVLVVHVDADAVNQLGTLFRCLHVPWRELGLRRDVADGAGHAGTAGIGEDRGRLADGDLRHRGLGHEHVSPRAIEVDNDQRGRPRRNDLAGLDELLSDDAADRRLDG